MDKIKENSSSEIVKSILEEGRIFTFDELKILLYACKVHELEGIYMPEKVFTEGDILYAMHHMEVNGIITARETGFCIHKDVLRMMEIMGKPERTYIWSPQENITEELFENEGMYQDDEFFCYESGGDIVVSERYWKKKDAVKLRIFQSEEFEIWKGEVRSDYCGG